MIDIPNIYAATVNGILQFPSLEEFMKGISFHGTLEKLSNEGTISLRLFVEGTEIGLSEELQKAPAGFLLEGKLHPLAEDGTVLYDAPLPL